MSDELAAAHRWGELAGGLAAAGPLLDAAVGEAAAAGAQYADVRLSEVEELRLYAVSGMAGHALELDRILGDEANFAGRSFIGRDAAGTLRYGSPAVNIVADATVPGTRGSFMFDDEGTRTRATMLITEGIVTNFLSSRDSAARIGAESTGAARSDGWGFLPLCFATNVFLAPGTASLDELLDQLGDGYYLDDNKSWSIDSQRLNFQFGTEVAWEVRGGRRGRLVRDFSYGGITPQFWGSAEAVAGPAEFATFGMPCGKGEPKEWGFLSHGAAPALFRDVRTGVA